MSFWVRVPRRTSAEDVQLPADVELFLFVFPPSLKIHYTMANGDLMRTSPVDGASCAAQGRLIAARFPDWAI